MNMNDPFTDGRNEVENRLIDDEKHYKILVVGRYANGTTDIVACLIRALRNLGHHILYFNAARHRGLLDNPTKARGGHGPIYVQADYLKDAVKRFRPQIVLLLANGMTFRPEDAAWLKGQGAVLVGATLSDPDVLESVATFAGEFDFHTTNAERALDMYKERGVQNTLYFPFGIDRGFVSQKIPYADEFAADIICLGHATARPERNGVMNAIHARIGEHYTLRTYGRGWELPGSRVVASVEMLQASRAGRIHVNFPATRAGYTNVKCGVFETIAAGALLVTQRFDEMAHFFDYDTEIVGYDTYEELPELLEALLNEPDRVKEMAQRAFNRLINEHLYEHRWSKLFETMRSIDASGWLGDARTSEVKEILAHSEPRCRPILLSGFYGARNLGDDLILNSIAGTVEDNVPGGRVTVAAQNPIAVEKDHGLEAFNRTDISAADYHADVADAVILGGGGLWHDYTFERAGGLPGLFNGAIISVTGFGVLPMLCDFRNVPLHVVGMGVGPLSDPNARVFVGHLARMAKSVTVRDAKSKELLDDILHRDDLVIQAPDVVYAVDLAKFGDEAEDNTGESSLRIGINLRPWARGKINEKVITENMAEALNQIITRSTKPVEIVLLPMQEGTTFDRAPLAMLQDLIGNSATFKELPTPFSLDTYLSQLRHIDILVAMRLHACLLAHRVGTRAIGLSYDPKVALHFEELGRGEYVLPLEFEADQLVRTINACIEIPFDKAFFDHRAAFEVKASTRLKEVARMISDTPQRDRPWTIPRSFSSAAKTPRKTPTKMPKAQSLGNSIREASFLRRVVRIVPHRVRRQIHRQALHTAAAMPILLRSLPTGVKHPIRRAFEKLADQ